ncbi:MAG TPA: ribonuclease E/G [Cyanobacteria bacterium UBA8803]|nr:ribonuclease E/G [Cyanobacteria bacterium UBA9273]HBL61723.1 ribonuclease E/G [Cyanobacteria bacterium UBA8803]
MPKQIIIAEQHRLAAVFWEDQIQELVVATGNHQVSDIYLGTVENVLPGIDAAFVNIGDPERNGFIHVTDLGPLRLKRRAGAITELLTPQQKVLVQIMKEPTGNKGPRLTGNITLPGRYLVLMPYGRGVNLSRRIKSDNERNRLRALAVLIKPPGMGLLVRTEAEGRAEEAIVEDLEALQKQWEAIQQEASSTRAPALLSRDDDFIQRVLRDMYTADVNRIVVDSHTGVKRVKQHLVSWSGGKTPDGVLIDHHRDRLPILDYFRVNAAIREALKPRVDLPSGGYIIIEPTEALTVIDVNSGSFTRSATARETVLWTNCEAATEIARQLRLRNIAGVIVVDFIDMDSRRDQLQVLEHFNKALKADKARPQIAQLSELGLVELTRKRQGQNIYELFGKPCATCGGLGHIVHLPGEVEAPPREVVEPAARLEARERETLDISEAFDLPPFNETDDLDLLNHPNYQERGGANTRRRRRRRPDEPVGKEEPLIVKGNSRPSPLSQPPLEPEAELDSPPPAPLGLALAQRSITQRGLIQRSSTSEEPSIGERSGKPQLIKSPKEFEPPKVVSIEMTPEEQDIYALMGISPLVLLDQEVKNPKSVVLSVVLPGASSQTEKANQIPSEASVEADTEALDEAPDSDQAVLTSSATANDTEVAPSPTSANQSESSTIIRRRRRRSSALEGEDSTTG